MRVLKPTCTLMQIEQVFEVESVEEAVTNLLKRDERWTKIALQNIGEAFAFLRGNSRPLDLVAALLNMSYPSSLRDVIAIIGPHAINYL